MINRLKNHRYKRQFKNGFTEAMYLHHVKGIPLEDIKQHLPLKKKSEEFLHGMEMAHSIIKRERTTKSHYTMLRDEIKELFEKFGLPGDRYGPYV